MSMGRWSMRFSRARGLVLKRIGQLRSVPRTARSPVATEVSGIDGSPRIKMRMFSYRNDVYVRYPLCIPIMIVSVWTPTSSDLTSVLYNG
jgi:hypothetical protein